MQPRGNISAGAWALATALLVLSCATGSVLNVTYQLPGPPAGSSFRAVGIGVEDARAERAILTPRAREELAGAGEVFALTVAAPGRATELRGAYPLEGLLKEILRLRLEQAGIPVAAEGPTEARVVLALEEFRLDFGDRRWIATVAFEVRAERGGTVAARQTVRGSNERMMVFKKQDAEKALGELVTDTLNQLNPADLLRRAGL